ncbi:hypothetical protein PVK06_002987 [Gossypium arboreum]|uniref:Elongin-C n=1 Tax=Gossypium arboreum TaxID=29729 RepID=A0ABR0R521_GOSAR|nr:hypothetical protein PVK06_002987 [Gossypium arboreum]
MVSQTIGNMLTSPGPIENWVFLGSLLFFGLKGLISFFFFFGGDGEGGFAEMELGEVTFPEISAVILEKICQYFYWALQYSRGKETEFHIEPELTLELMMAPNYLHT